MKFSVIIPTYNRRHQIGEAIDSVLAQHGVDIEIIVVDDGSSDGTVDWLAAAYPGAPLRVLRNARRKGPAGARNTGLLAAKGDLVAFLDSDDQFLPGHLESCRALFADHPEVGLIFGRARYEQNGQVVDYMGPNFERKLAAAPVSERTDKHILFTEAYFTHLLQFGCYFNLSTVALRRTAEGELMNEELRIAEDYEFWVRLSRSRRFACLQEPQIRYQLHDQNISFEAASSAADNAPNLIKAYRIMLGYPGLSPAQVRLVEGHLAETLFDWGYRCRKRGQYRDAMSRHWQSLRYGRTASNLAAILKTGLLSLIPGR